MEDKYRRNKCLYCMFQTCNIGVFIVGLGTTASGIYICVEAANFNWYNGSFVGLGVMIFLLGFLGYNSKYSRFSLLIYCILMFLCLITLIGFTLAIVVKDEFSNVTEKANGTAIKITLGSCCLLLLLCFLLSFCYRKSIIKNDSDVYPNQLLIKHPANPEPKRTSKYEEIRQKRNQESDEKKLEN